MSISDLAGGLASGGIGGAASSIIKMVSPEVAEVLEIMDNQQKLIENLVMNPLSTIVGEVEDGIWTGEGADAFLRECKEMFQPEAGAIKESIGDMRTRVSQAQTAIEKADKAAARKVATFAQLCEKIYPEGG